MNNIHTFVVLAYKESEFLEDCIKSCLNQSIKPNVIIATSTPNDYIDKIAKKYKLKVKVNKEKGQGIGYDFDFAKNAADTDLVTIAHQDDIYDYTYAEEVISAYKKQPKSIIIIPDYYEIRKDGKTYKNLNLNIKRILLYNLRLHFWSNWKLIKRSAIRFGNGISCPSVAFVNKNCIKDAFESDMISNVDWIAWEKLSKLKGYFYYIHKPLMGHRIYNGSTTSKAIDNNKRIKEDYEMFKLFWPKPIAKLLTRIYQNSEKSNKE